MLQDRLPPPVLDEWTWQTDALCRDPRHGPLWFSPEGERGPVRREREQRAKAVCVRCPVLLECRRHALEVAEPFGVWGGLSELNRRKILNRPRDTWERELFGQ